ncbi:fumarylacetoacetate hydrolase family protein [Bacillus massiliigorillae]|uniref:fumarylacetoacetate hydrolase family protein n=1 Tax=Bacillus massiliigorillae TaxID=1243664 RepID=UPI0003A28AEF|nr:fumarylacetoacetate hydrolase family protein [Bacillus massiliigorillae]
MKFVTFKDCHGKLKLGWIKHNYVFDMYEVSNGRLPDNMMGFIKSHHDTGVIVKDLFASLNTSSYMLDKTELVAPLPNPTSIRDFMAFEEHLQNATKRSDMKIAPEWYEIPVFYFTNHMAVVGPEQDVEKPIECKNLDYELEIACIIGKQGKDIKAEEAEEYIFGYTIMNDWSARDLQFKEMKVGLGPAKGKDFATSIGPCIVTKDELEEFRENNQLHLSMTAKVNGVLLSKGNFKDIFYTFGQMIERASAGVTLFPGEIIGSGTVGNGCLLELGSDVHRWLETGDVVELEITGIGTLKNKIQ